MKALVRCAAIIIALATVPSADAKGCIKGALVGGVAGHYAVHHGLLGAATGCIIGRHEAKRRAQMKKEQTNKDIQTNQAMSTSQTMQTNQNNPRVIVSHPGRFKRSSHFCSFR